MLTVAATLSPEDVVIHTGISSRGTNFSIVGTRPTPRIFQSAKHQERPSCLACIRPSASLADESGYPERWTIQ